ncbi:MAG TPA: hypothetical protein VHI52_04980 [Verrucomicrobiae bacterium]|nr:hypothetical protein [Verrucomicrobiae bacterium]
MLRLVQLALLTVLGFLGAVLAWLGGFAWYATKGSVTTVFDTLTRSGEYPLMDANVDWLDKAFLAHRAGAVVVVLAGVSTMFWAVFFMLKASRGELNGEVR